MEELFEFRINYTSLTQGYRTKGNTGTSSVSIKPNTAIDILGLAGAYQNLTPIRGFIQEMQSKEVTRFFLQRTFSLGDVLILIPIIRYLKRQGFDAYIRTTGQYVDLLSYFTKQVEDITRAKDGDWGILLDWTVEKEHWHPEVQAVSRPNIYIRALGLPPVTKTDLNWDCNLSSFPKLNFGDMGFDKNEYVVFQGQGATEIRGIPFGSIQYLINQMNKAGIRVVYIGAMQPLMVDETMTKLQFMQSSLPELISWIGGAKAVVSMDSSPLWVSYFTKTPLIAILNATHPKKRIELHPLEPEGAMAISLGNEYGCEPCYELAEKCKHRMPCRDVNPERIWELIREPLLRFVG